MWWLAPAIRRSNQRKVCDSCASLSPRRVLRVRLLAAGGTLAAEMALQDCSRDNDD
jgi:hypothetical protein